MKLLGIFAAAGCVLVAAHTGNWPAFGLGLALLLANTAVWLRG